MFLYLVKYAFLLYSIYKFLGWSSVKYQFVYSFWGVCYLEGIKYVEHYGLQRKNYEKVIYDFNYKSKGGNTFD